LLRLSAHPLRWRLLTELAHTDLRVRELAARTGEPQNLISYHLRLLRDGELVTVSRSSFDGRDSYYRLNLHRYAVGLAETGAALHPALRGVPALPEPRGLRWRSGLAVLFVCTGNSARSPIAEALLRHHTGGRVEALSAGSRPQPTLQTAAVRALREHFGIDIAGQRPRHLDALAGRPFDYVITLCDKAREVCPEFGDRSRRLHWSTPDPTTSGDTGAFAQISTEIDIRVRYLLPLLAVSDRPTFQEAPS
jgi:protein-tyrosine-phosphatase/DNA-binding transcriptional ArsR family regulator